MEVLCKDRPIKVVKCNAIFFPLSPLDGSTFRWQSCMTPLPILGSHDQAKADLFFKTVTTVQYSSI